MLEKFILPLQNRFVAGSGNDKHLSSAPGIW
jgi:hypothetical protein